MRIYILIASLALVLLTDVAGEAFAVEPVVSNVQLQQRTDGSRIVEIIYDLADVDDAALSVSLQLSANAGASWHFPVLHASGDVGADVAPGLGKTILLDYSQLAEPLIIEDLRARVLASDRGVERWAHAPRHVAVIQLNAFDWADETKIEQLSRADLLVVTAHDIWAESSYADEPVIPNLKALNPDLKVVGYVSAFSSRLSGAVTSTGSFWYEWYHRMLPYWVYTTTGDTAQTWPGNVVINILDPDCRRDMIDTIIEFQDTSLNKMDGVYWDYFNNQLWIAPGLDVEGEIDMDQDGIGHFSDADEKAAYRAAQVELVSALRDSLGESFIQIFNGQRAYGDSTFAKLADGVMYELYPTLFFPQPDLQNSLDPSYVNNLFAVRNQLRDVNGGPYVILSNVWQSFYWDQNSQVTMIRTGNTYRAVALIMDGYAAWNSHDGDTFSYSYGWPDVEVSLGQPLGPVTFEDPFIRREFQYGSVEIEMTNGNYPNPFDYRIWALGEIIEELAIPYHYP